MNYLLWYHTHANFGDRAGDYLESLSSFASSSAYGSGFTTGAGGPDANTFNELFHQIYHDKLENLIFSNSILYKNAKK